MRKLEMISVHTIASLRAPALIIVSATDRNRGFSRMLRINADNPQKSVASVKIRGSNFCLTGRNDDQRPERPTT
jgi:hypothetical protein